MQNAADKLIAQIKKKNSPIAVGLDTALSYLPDDMTAECKTLRDAAAAVTAFNRSIIDAVYDLVPCVKIQVAYYEALGFHGMRAFYDTARYAKRNGLLVIADVKRNDIGSTAAAYSSAYFSGVTAGGKTQVGFPADFITVNPYLGTDGIKPFVDDCISGGKGIFILCKTSNPGGGELQDRRLDDGKTLYGTVAELIEQWGTDARGKRGYSAVGAVVGATYPVQAAELRKLMPHALFLVPGYGAQGGGAQDILPAFDKKGGGAIVNNSRGILCAYKNKKYAGRNYAEAARLAALDMKNDIASVMTLTK